VSHAFSTIERREAEALAAHVLAALAADNGGEPPTGPRRDWVKYRFEEPLKHLLKQANSNARGHLVTNLVVIAGGFATSGIALAAKGGKGTPVSWVVFAIGLLVALAGGVAQTLRLGQRANQRTALAAELREEGWAFVHRLGPYDPSKVSEPFAEFDRRLSDIHRRASEIAVLEDATAKPRRRSSSQQARRTG
jgi:hypothetical protein